ncbi:MAG TPA: hypothetical protein H9700_12440 [Candidatus Eisenbergiella intestinipullorum]|nr:hypothetical protein [Candidatus Eisenbergiella intestinipullorum]
MKKRLLTLLGILIFFLSIVGIGKIMKANYDGNQSMEGFYALDKNTVDVMCYGSSHVYAGISPVVLWEEYGISSYDLAGTYQPLWNTYYNMKETLKYQKPEVMIVDLYGITSQNEYSETTNFIKNVSSMRMSWNKIQNICASVPPEKFLTYFFEYPLIHDSYTEISQGNYEEEVNNIGGDCFKGFRPSFEVTRFDQLEDIKKVKEKTDPGEKNREYLQKMEELAEENGIELVFLVVPYAGINAEHQAWYNWVKDWAEERKIAFLDGNCMLEDMQFDINTGFAEESHLNYTGAECFTHYLGEYLAEHYSLKDRRKEGGYQSWQKYSDCWERYIWGRSISEIGDLKEYVDMISTGTDYILAISMDGEYESLGQDLEQLKKLGLTSEDLKRGGCYAIKNNRVLYQSPDEEEYLWYMEMGSYDLAVRREYGQRPQIVVNRAVENAIENGINIYVYDCILDRSVDSVGFSVRLNEAIR